MLPLLPAALGGINDEWKATAAGDRIVRNVAAAAIPILAGMYFLCMIQSVCRPVWPTDEGQLDVEAMTTAVVGDFSDARGVVR